MSEPEFDCLHKLVMCEVSNKVPTEKHFLGYRPLETQECCILLGKYKKYTEPQNRNSMFYLVVRMY